MSRFLLAILVCVSGCSRPIQLSVVNETEDETASVTFETLAERATVGPVRGSETAERRWRLAGLDRSDGDYTVTIATARDTLSQCVGYYTNGAVDARRIAVTLRPSAYEIVLTDRVGTETRAFDRANGDLTARTFGVSTRHRVLYR